MRPKHPSLPSGPKSAFGFRTRAVACGRLLATRTKALSPKFVQRKHLGALASVAVGMTASSESSAATVLCEVHAGHGFYKIELFRVGDRSSTRTDEHIKIDGGKLVSYANVPTGNWFVRVTPESSVYRTVQGPGTDVTGWHPWRWLPDVWVTPA